MYIKVALDPGHGMSNTTAGIFDPGATVDNWRECDMALKLALTCKFVFHEENIPFFMVRSDNIEPCPLRTRPNKIHRAKCTHVISFHMNASETRTVQGGETFYRDDKPFAEQIQNAMMWAFSMNDRGVKHESESAPGKLHILSGRYIAALGEFGFLTNGGDTSMANNRQRRVKFAEIMAEYFLDLMEKKEDA